jgi:hypothetical protein
MGDMLRRVHDADVTSTLTREDRGVYHYGASFSRRIAKMCLNCGCMRAHYDIGKPGVNITYEDVKRAADKDRGDHPAEYQAAG